MSVESDGPARRIPEAPSFGEYLVYVDESGDHGLENVSPDYPVFVLLFVLVRKSDYIASVCPALQNLKLRFWGHDEVVMHEHEIRKPKGSFQILHNRDTREAFTIALSEYMRSLPVTVVAVVIDKPAYVRKYHVPVSPYDYALEAGLERIFLELNGRGQGAKVTPVIVECRGQKEDAELELAFRRVCDGSNQAGRKLPFTIVMIPKAANSAGLQIADLMARPVGLKHIRPTQVNRAFEIIHHKLRRSGTGKIEGWGLKILP